MHAVKVVFIALLTALAAIGSARPSDAKDPVYTSVMGVAIGGTDAVAYFTKGRPVAGSAEFIHTWNGATWRFSTAGNRDLFAADPERYAPQYGGYCAYAVSEGYTASTDPAAWKIVGGKLYLNYNKQVQQVWERNVPARIEAADGNWPAVLK